MRSRFFFALLAGLLLLNGCDQAAVSTRAPITLTIAGATAMQPLLRDLTTEFSRQHPSILFDLRGGGSSLGEDAVRAGRVDLAASTLFAPSDLDPNAEVDDQIVRTPVGLDGLALIVNDRNPVRELTLQELQRLYRGRVIDWDEFVPGRAANDEGARVSPANDVVLVSREDGSGARILFESRVMNGEPVALTSVVMPTSAAVADYVARNPQAIGYLSRAYVTDLFAEPADEAGVETEASSENGDADEQVTVAVVAIEGALPTAENLLTQQYALTQPLYLVTNAEADGERSQYTRQFVDFALSPAGQEIVGRYHARVR